MKYGKEVRKRLDPLMEKYGFEWYDFDGKTYPFYVSTKKGYLQTLQFYIESNTQVAYCDIQYNCILQQINFIISGEYYSFPKNLRVIHNEKRAEIIENYFEKLNKNPKQDLLNKLDNEWLPRIEAALNKQWIKPGIDFLDGSIDEDIYNNYQTYAKEVLSSKDYPFNNIKDVRYIINDLLSQNLSYKDFMKKASSVYIKYVLEADNEFKELELGEYLGFRYNIYIKNGIKWPYKTIRVLGVIISFWHFGDRDSLEFGRGFYGINDDGDVVDTRQSEGIIERINNGEIVKLIY